MGDVRRVQALLRSALAVVEERTGRGDGGEAEDDRRTPRRAECAATREPGQSRLDPATARAPAAPGRQSDEESEGIRKLAG